MYAEIFSRDFRDTHTEKAHSYRGKGLASRAVTVPASVGCFIHSADGMRLVSSSVMLTQENGSKKMQKQEISRKKE